MVDPYIFCQIVTLGPKIVFVVVVGVCVYIYIYQRVRVVCFYWNFFFYKRRNFIEQIGNIRLHWGCTQVAVQSNFQITMLKRI